MALPVFLVVTTVPAVVMGITAVIVATAAVVTVVRIAHAAAEGCTAAAAQGGTYHSACAAAYGLAQYVATRGAKTAANGCFCFIATLGAYRTARSTCLLYTSPSPRD